MNMKSELEYYKQKYQKYFYISNSTNANQYSDIYIKNSNIHGLGVFANKDFVEGEPITRYPAHYIYKLNEYPIYNINSSPPSNFKEYRYDLNNNISIIGNSTIYNNLTLVGHMCNDGYKHNFETNNKKNRNSYNKKSKLYNNAMFLECDDSIINIVSTKNIKKNEEILVAYGFNYWLE